MNIPHHDITYEKAKRMGNGNIAPLTNSLKLQMQVPNSEAFGRPMFVEKPKNFYLQIHESPTNFNSPVAGLTRRYDITSYGGKSNFSRIFPQYGLNNAKFDFTSMKLYTDVTEKEHAQEANNKCKLFYK